MAGDWIKMRCDLDDDPAVIAIAEATGLAEDNIVGKLWKIWRWANEQTVDGNAVGVTKTFVDRYLGVVGFADAMVKVGWLLANSDGIAIPNFDKHNSQSAKKRALTAKRVASHKGRRSNAGGNAGSVSDALPREEKRREVEEANASCSEPASPSSEPAPSPPIETKIILTFPTVGKGGKEWHLTEGKFHEYRESFPGVDVLAQCRAALQWCRDNPAKQKTPRGMAAFLTRWLSKEQNRGGSRASGAASPAIDEREHKRKNDARMAELERQARRERADQNGVV